jgi:DNA polymerase-1
MKALYLICFEAKPGVLLKKTEIYDLIQQRQGEYESLAFFGDLSAESDDRSAKTKLGKNLIAYDGRELDLIRMERQGSGDSGRTDRASFRFVKIDEPGEDQGNKIAESVFRGTKLPPPPSADGTLGDLGDLSSTVIIKTTITTGERREEEKGGNIYTVAGGAGKSLQGLQRLHPTGEVPTLLTSVNDLQVVASAIKGVGGPVSQDIETWGPERGDALNPFKGEIRLLTLSAGEHRPWLLDLKAIGYDLGPLKPVLEQSEIIGHNHKFDALWLKLKCGVSLNQVFCTMTASRLLAAGTKEGNDLGECLQRYLQVDLPKDQGESDWGAPVLSSEQLRYAADDVLYLEKLKAALLLEINKNGLERVCALEQSLLPVVVGMEARGIEVDRAGLLTIQEAAEREARTMETALRQLVGDADFNPASTKQLMEKFKLRGVKLSNSTKETLTACNDSLATEILKYRKAVKRVEQTETLLKAVGCDGRIHSSFNPMAAKTGRFSSSDPPLQNVSRGSLRDCFTAGAGNVLVVADYSQIELRAVAAIAKEEKMLAAYRNEQDLHKRTASIVLGKGESEVTRADRQLAKAVNFGLIYGQGPAGLVGYARKSYGVNFTEMDARQFRTRFFDAYPGLRHWHEEARSKARSGALEVRTLTGRRRLLPQDATSEGEWNRFAGLVNTVVQGSCADGLKMAMVELSKRLPSDASIVSTVHDELIVEVPKGKSEEVKQLVEQCMVEKMRELFPEVPIEVEVKICKTWGEK